MPHDITIFIMKRLFLKFWKLTLSSILTLTGFSACNSDEDNEDESILLMYGPPTATFHINGEVSDIQGQPVSDATVVLKAYGLKDNQEYIRATDTTSTNGAGQYDFYGRLVASNLTGIRIICEDPDGGFETDSAEFTRADEAINFTLKKK